jgi:hypothetical protein
MAVGADVNIVSLLQLLRFMLVLISLPFLSKYHISTETKQNSGSPKETEPYSITRAFPFKYRGTFASNLKKLGDKRVLLTLLLAFTGGVACTALSIPAGGMFGALFLLAVVSLKGVKLEAPPNMIREIMQIGLGVMIGSNFSRESFSVLYSMLLPVLVFTLLINGSYIILAFVLKKMTGWGIVTCILAAAPGGFTATTAMAFDLDCQPFEVSMLQLARILLIETAILPFILLQHMWI